MDLEVQIMQLKDRLTAANMDSEKQSIAMLTKVNSFIVTSSALITGCIVSDL